MADVRVIHYDVGSPTDEAMERIRKAIHGTSASDAFRRSVTLADYVVRTQAAGRKVLIQKENGQFFELVLE